MLVSWRVLTGMILQVAPYDFILKLLGSCLRRQVAARLCNELSTDATPCRRELEKHKDWCSEVKIQGSLNYQYWADQNGIKQRKSIMLRSFPSKIMPCLTWCDIMPPVIHSEELVRYIRGPVSDHGLEWNMFTIPIIQLIGAKLSYTSYHPTQIILFAPTWWHSYNPKDRLYTCIMSSVLHCLVSVQTPFCLISKGVGPKKF